MIIFWVVLFAILTEGLTELLVKSEIFVPIRNILFKIPYLGKAFVCGYCSSVWMAILPASIFTWQKTIDIFWPLQFLIWLVVFHRISNYFHNINDKWFDKYYTNKKE